MPGGPTGDVVAFIRDAVTRYSSATQALKDFRATGMRIANDTWYRAFNNQTQGFMLSKGWTARDLRTVPGPEMVGTWEAGQPGLFAYHMRIPVTSTETGLTTDRYYTYLSDKLIAPSTSMRYGVADYQAAIDTEKYPQMLGVPEFRGIFQTV